MRALIRRLADDGITVLLSSHLLAEVEELCNRVAIVRRGRVVYEGAPRRAAAAAGATYRLRTTDDERALAVCAAQRGHRGAPRAATDGVHRLPRRRRAGRRRALAGADGGRARWSSSSRRAGDARGPLLRAHRGRDAREADAARIAEAASLAEEGRREPPGHAHRLPLGAAQAALAEADVPRPRRRGARPARSSSSPSRSRAARPEDVPFGRYIDTTGLAIPLVLLLFGSIWFFPLITALVAGDIVADRGPQRHAEDDPDALGRAPSGLRRQGARRAHLRDHGDPASRASSRRASASSSPASTRSRASPGPVVQPGRGLVLVGASLLVYLIPILAIACDRAAVLDGLPQQRGGDRRRR